MVLYIGLAALALTIVGLIYIAVNEKKKESLSYWNAIVSVFVVVAVLATITLMPYVAMRVSVDDIVAENVAEYEELMLYKHTVEQSNNEYLRWNYYEKVEEWNRRYDAGTEKFQSESFWFEPYQFDYFVGTSRIEFELRGDE